MFGPIKGIYVPHSIANVQKKCPHLVNVIRNQRQLLDLTSKQLNLIECFLRPEEMVLKPETPLPRDANEEILELGQDGQPRLKVKQVSPDQMADPIYTLFNPPEGWRDGESACTLGQHACIRVDMGKSSVCLSVCVPVWPSCRPFRCTAPPRSGQPHCPGLQFAS